MQVATRFIAFVLLQSALACGQAAEPAASSAPRATPGKAAFDRWCAECHAPGHGHPGTQQLERTRGPALAVLEQRTDLAPALVRVIVRNGLNAMPAYRPSEISDAELEQIVLHLVRTPAATRRRGR